ncbi:hypothetical protein B0H11DRAFT_2227288 [Mycena galericulata]|nr:hypothetical protein B0H11DRAFT_2227288 [Mycena galericulata]
MPCHSSWTAYRANVTPSAFATSASRFEHFAPLIGHQPATEDSEARYSRWEVPILYDQWDGKVDVNHLFRGPMPLKVYASLIRGKRGAEGLFEGLSKRPQASCLERIYKIKRTTAGAISNAVILTVWLFSADTQLVQVGEETTIDYGYRHRLYVRRIREGLCDKKAWAIDLLEYWDSILFPNADISRDHGAAGDELEDEDEFDDIFAQAPSTAERAVPRQLALRIAMTTMKTIRAVRTFTTDSVLDHPRRPCLSNRNRRRLPPSPRAQAGNPREDVGLRGALSIRSVDVEIFFSCQCNLMNIIFFKSVPPVLVETTRD